MTSPTRSHHSPTVSRVTTLIPNTTVVSPRSPINRSQLEESISSLQNEQENVQKKTFTKWVNIYLSLHDPPYFVHDLFDDFKDGIKLIALLEVLSGQSFPVERGRKRAHFMSNVSNVLKYLESRKIKLVNIRPLDIVDGKSVITLGLIWMLILCYQIEDSHMFDEDAKDNRSKAKETLLNWIRKKTTGFYSSSESLRQFDELNVRDFTSSWRDGLAFNALIHAIRPDLVDLRRVLQMNVVERLENAFSIAEQHLNIPRLIDVEDVDVNKPDEKSIMTYLSQFSRRFPDLPIGALNKEHGDLLKWLNDIRQELTSIVELPIRDLPTEYRNFSKQIKDLNEKQKQWKIFERKQIKSGHFPSEKLKELKDLFDDVSHRLKRWRHKLDTSLPGEFGPLADWINSAEEFLARGIPFDPLKMTPEENSNRFEKLHEEHAAIFNEQEHMLNIFQRIKRDPNYVPHLVSLEHLTDLNQRLEILINESEERGRYLQFEDTHWKVQKYFVQLEYLMICLNKKYGDVDQTEQLYEDYKRKVYDDKLLATVESLLPELSCYAQNYSQLVKKDDRISKEFTAYCENIRRSVKTMTIELKSKEHLLQDTVHHWKIYLHSYDSVDKWLEQGRHVLRGSSDEKQNYFSHLDHWTPIYEKLRTSIERLIPVSVDEISQSLLNKLNYINRRWKETIDSIHQFQQTESIRNKRDEFYTGRGKLLEVLNRIENDVHERVSCSTRVLKDQENRLYEAQADLEEFNRSVQNLARLSNLIAKESGESNASTEMNSLLQICFDKLAHIQEYLPLILKRNKILLGHLQKFDENLDECERWIHDANERLSHESEDFDEHRNFFAQLGFYRSLIESKTKLLGTMRKSIENFPPVNFTSIDEQIRKLIENLEFVDQRSSIWEKTSTRRSALLDEFHQRLKDLENWIRQGQNLIEEKNGNLSFLIEKHESFFRKENDEILQKFLLAAQTILNEDQRRRDADDIRTLMENLQRQWNDVVSYAPQRLARLKFERIEKILLEQIRQAEDELTDELICLEREKSTGDEIIRRHNEFFHWNHFHSTIDEHFKQISTHSAEHLRNLWEKLQIRIADVRRKLENVPKQRKDFEEKFELIERWMTSIERSMNETKRSEVSFEEYKVIANLFKNDVQHIDSVGQDVKILPTLLENLIADGAMSDPHGQRQRLDNLLNRYRNFVDKINETSERCSMIIAEKILHEKSSKLRLTLSQLSNAPVGFQNLNDVRTGSYGQTKLIEILEKHRKQLDEILQQAKTSLRDVPKDVQNLEKLFNEKFRSAKEFAENLQSIAELWERFDTNQRRFEQQIERFQIDFDKIQTDRTSISSFEHEIDHCQFLRTNLMSLRVLIEENADILQKIITKNLLPHENLEKLRTTNERSNDEFSKYFRQIENFLDDFKENFQRWKHFQDEIQRLESLFREIGSMFDARMFGESPLEEKQQILERIRSELGEHLHSLSLLHSDASNLQSARFRSKDLSSMVNRLDELKILAQRTSDKVNREEEQLVQCRTHVELAQRYRDQLQKWIEQSEEYLTKRLDQHGVLNLQQAKQFHDQHKIFLEERRRISTIYTNLISEEKQLTDQYELKSLIQSLAFRWSDIVKKSDQLTPIYDRQYSAWLLFESELNAFRDQILLDLEQRVQTISNTDFQQLFDLNRIEEFLNDLRNLDEQVHTFATNYNRLHKQLNDLRQFSSAEGQRILHEEQMSIETRWYQVNRIVSEKLREIERLYDARKSFHNRYEVFLRTVNDIHDQMKNNGEIGSTTLNDNEEQIEEIRKQIQALQPLIATLGQDVHQLNYNHLISNEFQTIQKEFNSHKQRLQSYETVLHKRLDLFKRYQIHRENVHEIRLKMERIHADLEEKQQWKITEINVLQHQLDRCTIDLRTLETESLILDRLMEDSQSTIIDPSTNRSISFMSETRILLNLFDMIANKLVQRRRQAEELDRLVDDFTQSHTDILFRIHALKNQLRVAYLGGYSPRYIEELLLTIKGIQRDVQMEETRFRQLSTKFETLRSNWNDEEKQRTEENLRKLQSELKELIEQIDQRQERLTRLMNKRQEYEQILHRLTHWYEDKQRLITSEWILPLKITDMERFGKRYEIIDELETQRTNLEKLKSLLEEIKVDYQFEGQNDCDLNLNEWIKKFNIFDEKLVDRQEKFRVGLEQRQNFDKKLDQLSDWTKSIEQQVKDPMISELQQTTNLLQEKSSQIQILLQSVRDRLIDFEDLTQLYGLIQTTLSESDRLVLDERYLHLKDRYNRLLDHLTQRFAFLNESTQIRIQCDEMHQSIESLSTQIRLDFDQWKRDDSLNSLSKRIESLKILIDRCDQLEDHLKELMRTQRTLTSQGHRLDLRQASEMNINLQHLQGQFQTEFERLERISQTERDFHQLEKDFDTFLQSTESMRTTEIYQTIVDRIQQSEHQLKKLSQIAERLRQDLPATISDQLKQSIETRRERLQNQIRLCEQNRTEREQKVKIQEKFEDELINIHDWFRRLIQEYVHPIEINLSIENVEEVQKSIVELSNSIDERLNQFNLMITDDIEMKNREIRERFDLIEKLKYQVKSYLTKHRSVLEELHQNLTKYFQLTSEIKTSLCDVDLKLAPFYDGYNHQELDNYEKEFHILQEICTEQNLHLVEIHRLVEFIQKHVKPNGRELCENQLRHFHQTLDDLETRLHQRRDELEEIRSKSTRFQLAFLHLQTDIDRLSLRIDKVPEISENLLVDLDATYSALQYLSRDLKKSLDMSSSAVIDEQMKTLVHSLEQLRTHLDRLRKSHEDTQNLHERLERLLEEIKLTSNRIEDDGQKEIRDRRRRKDFIKNLLKDLDFELNNCQQAKELIERLNHGHAPPSTMPFFEQKHQEIEQHLRSLKNDLIQLLIKIDQQIKDEESLRQKIRANLALIQRLKGQLMELRPTISGNEGIKFKKIQDESQSLNLTCEEYRRNEDNLPDDLRSLLEHLMNEIESMEKRISEKSDEFHQFYLLKEDFDRSIENFNEILQSKSQTNSRSLLDHLSSLSSELTLKLSNATERDQIRRRLHDVFRRSIEMEEMNEILQSNGEKWINEVQKALKENLSNEKLKTLMKNFSNYFDSIRQTTNPLTNKFISIRDELQKKIETNERLVIEENQIRLHEQWTKNIDEIVRTLPEQKLTFEEKCEKLEQIQNDVNKRKDSMKNFPQIDQIQREISRLRKDFQVENDEKKTVRQQIDLLFDYLKENHQYQSISDKRDLASLQDEYQRLLDEQTRLNEKIHQIDSIRHSSRDFEYLRERFIETDKDLHRRITFMKNLIRTIEEKRRSNSPERMKRNEIVRIEKTSDDHQWILLKKEIEHFEDQLNSYKQRKTRFFYSTAEHIEFIQNQMDEFRRFAEQFPLLHQRALAFPSHQHQFDFPHFQSLLTLLQHQFEDQHDYLVQCETKRRAFSTHCRVFENVFHSIFERLTTNVGVEDFEKLYEDFLHDEQQLQIHREKFSELYENLDGETRSKHLNEFFDFERRSNDFHEKLFFKIRRFDEFFRQYQEFQLRFEHLQNELNEIEENFDRRPIPFEKRLDRLNFLKEIKQKFIGINSELIHLHDEMTILHQQNAMLQFPSDFQEKFSQLDAEIRLEFDRHSNAMILADEFDENRRQIQSNLSIERSEILSDCRILLEKLTNLQIYDLTNVKNDFEDLIKQIELFKGNKREETLRNERSMKSPSRQAFDQLVELLRSSPTKEMIFTHQRTIDFLNETILTETFVTEEFLNEIHRLNFDWLNLKSTLFVSQPRQKTFVQLNFSKRKTNENEQIDDETWKSLTNTYISLLDRFSQLDHRWTMMYKEKFSFHLDEFQEKVKDFHVRLEQIDEILLKFSQQIQPILDHRSSLTAHKIQTFYSILSDHKFLFDEFLTQLRHLYDLNAKIDEIRRNLTDNESNDQIEKLLRSIDELNKDECSSKILEEYSFYHQLMEWENYISAIEKNFAVIEENSQTNSLGLIEIDRNIHQTIEDLHQREKNWNQFVKFNEENRRCRELDQRWKEIRNSLIEKEKIVSERIQLWSNFENARQSYLRHRMRFSGDGQEEKKRLFDEIQQMYQNLLRQSDLPTRLTLEKDFNDVQLLSSSSFASCSPCCSSSSTSSNRKEKILLRYNEIDRKLDELNGFLKSIRILQQQSIENVDEFTQQCQTKLNELIRDKIELTHVRKGINDISSQLHADDTRQLIQKLNLLEIQWADGERLLNNLIDKIRHKRFECEDFDEKIRRFHQWFENFFHRELNQRLDGLTLTTMIDFLRHDLRPIIREKEIFLNDLISQARLLQSKSTDVNERISLGEKIENLEKSFSSIDEQIETKIKQIQTTMKMFEEFEQGIDHLQLWIDTVERTLEHSVRSQSFHSNELQIHQDSIEVIENDIDEHRPLVRKILALGENLLNQSEIRASNIDVLSQTMKIFESRWNGIQQLIQKRKFDLTSVNRDNNLDENERFIEEIRRKQNEDLVDIRHELEKLQNFKKRLEFEKIDEKNPSFDRWKNLNATVDEMLKNFKHLLSIHADIQLTRDSFVLWLTDLDVVLTNLEHLSLAPASEKLRELEKIQNEIDEKRDQLNYVETCANHLLSRTRDARGLSIDVNELKKFGQQLNSLTKRISKFKENLCVTFACRSPIDEDFDEMILQITADLRSKQDRIQSSTPRGIQFDELPPDFSFKRMLTSTKRKIDRLNDFPADSRVHEIVTKLSTLERFAEEKDDELKRHRTTWRNFQRDLEKAEKLGEEMSRLDRLVSRPSDKNDGERERLEEFQRVFQSALSFADEFRDESNNWIRYEHRIRRLKDKFRSTKTTNLDEFLVDLQTQLDRFDSLRKSLEPIDDHPTYLQTNRTKLHRFIRLDDDLEIFNDRLLRLHDQQQQLDERPNVRRHLQSLFDRLHKLKRVIKIDLEKIETILVKQRLNSLA